jgi:hypothetical protein
MKIITQLQVTVECLCDTAVSLCASQRAQSSNEEEAR